MVKAGGLDGMIYIVTNGANKMITLCMILDIAVMVLALIVLVNALRVLKNDLRDLRSDDEDADVVHCKDCELWDEGCDASKHGVSGDFSCGSGVKKKDEL